MAFLAPLLDLELSLLLVMMLRIPNSQEGNQEVEVQQAGLEEPEEEVECPNHEPASFVKGKPRSILSLPLFSKVYLICYIY